MVRRLIADNIGPRVLISTEARREPRVLASIYLIYKAECVCVCMFAMCASFLLHLRQTRCGCLGHPGQVIARFIKNIRISESTT